MTDAARQFLGKHPEKRDSWFMAFKSDPQRKYIDRIQNIRSGKIINYIHTPLTHKDIGMVVNRNWVCRASAKNAG